MNLLRTEEQAILQDVLIITQESADRLEDTAEFLEHDDTREALESMAHTRNEMAQAIRQALSSSGDLPSAPDLDREDAEHVIRRVRAWLTPDTTQAEFLTQAAAADRKLSATLRDHREGRSDDDIRRLLDRVIAHADTTADELETLARRLHA